MKHWMYIVFVGFVWLFMGFFLLIKGISFLKIADLNLIKLVLLGLLSLFLGYVKSRFVFKKVVKKVVNRILSLSLPISLLKAYDKKFYLLILVMMMLGFLLKFLGIPYVVRGTIDLSVGMALIKGGIDYFIVGLSFKKISYL